MYMKKAVALVTLLSLVAVFSCAVFADTTVNPNSFVSYSTVDNNVSLNIQVATLYPEYDVQYENFGYNSGMLLGDVTHVGTIRITNNNAYNVYTSTIGFQVGYTGGGTQGILYNTKDIENYSSDFTVSYIANNSYYYAIPSVNFSFQNRICVPRNTTLVAMFTWKTGVASDNPLTNVTYYKASQITMVQDFKAYQTDFTPLGSHDDILISLEALRNYLIGSNGIPSINSSLSTINTTLNTMYTNLHTDITRFQTEVHSDLTDIKNILNGNSSTNTGITNDSNSLKSTSDTVHSQEQAYFTQNSQAIQATGLGNYQFGTVEGNGISAVSNDFTSVWNALGGWTSVYIFSLTLGLALTIIRHAPNAISRRLRRKSSE